MSILARLPSPLFLERYRKFLKPGGIIHLKTDSRFLHEYTKAVAFENNLSILATEPVDNDALYEVQTFYERMFLSQGYKITYLAFTIDHEGPYMHPSFFDSDYWRSIEGPRRFSHQTDSVRKG